MSDETTNKPQDTPQTVVYVGPLSRKLGIHYGQTFIGGLPTAVAQFKAQYPAFGLLFVPLDQLAATRDKMKRAGNPYQTTINNLASVL